jgi:hypothetical protein
LKAGANSINRDHRKSVAILDSMRIIRPPRATPPRVERTAKSTPAPKRRVTGDIVDEDFMRAPVDLRRMALSQLPQTNQPIDESNLSLPLFPVVGSRIHTAPDRSEGRAVSEILGRITVPKEPLAEFHLSEHLLPPVHYRFCPEQAYVEQTIHRVTRDCTMDTPALPPYMRLFPVELFNVSRDTKRIQGTQSKHGRRTKRGTFLEGDPLEGLKIL